MPRLRHINLTKPYLEHDMELTRLIAARRVCASIGIFGNSRTEVGLDPDSTVIHTVAQSAFNHAISGSLPITAYRQLGWLRQVGCMPKTIIIGVDFFDFLGSPPSPPLPSIALDPPPTLTARFLSRSVVSLAGLGDSLRTLRVQFETHPATTTPLGYNPLHNYIREVEHSGHRTLFRQRLEDNLQTWRNKSRTIEDPTSAANMAFNGILDRAAAGDATVHIVIYPYHGEIRLIIERLGLGALFDDFKKMLVASARKHERGSPIRVWDFSGISPEIQEAIPELNDRRTHMSYYWEAGHFKKNLGDKMLARMLIADSAFGVELTQGNIERELGDDRKRLGVLATSDLPLTAEVDHMMAGQRR